MGALTQADGGFACPAAICFAGAVLRATLEGEALLASVDECVAHGGQVQGPDVGVGWRLWLLAVVGWTRRETLLDLGAEGLRPFPFPEETCPPPVPFRSLSCPASPPTPSPTSQPWVYRTGHDGHQVDAGLSAPGTTACSTYPEGRGVTKAKARNLPSEAWLWWLLVFAAPRKFFLLFC